MRKLGVTPELVSLLNGNADFAMADLYTITLNGGTVLRYTNADKVITTPAAVNNAIQSEDLTTSWTASAMNVDANALADPVGGTTMDKLRPTTLGATHSIAATANITYTAAAWTHTFYTLASGYRWLRFAAQGVIASVDTLTGTVGLTAGGATVVVTAMGSGIYRWDVTGTQTAAGAAPSFTVNNANSTSQIAFAGDGTSAIGVWGVMAYPGTAFTTYLKTTTVARTLAARTFLRGPLFTRSRITHKLGVEVSSLEVQIDATNVDDLVSGVGFITFVVGNGLDGAAFQLERAFMSDWSLPATGALIDFAGRVTSIRSISRIGLSLTVTSWTVLLNANFPPDLFQAPCLNSLFDTNCTLVKASFAVAGTVAAGATTVGFNTNLVNASGYFDQGQIIFTSGANNGLSRAVKTYVSGSGAMTLILPLPAAPANGDTFTAYPGCDLTTSTCTSKFSNLIHYRGDPYVPPVETAL